MDKQHKDILRGMVRALRHLLLGGAPGGDGQGSRGDLDREMERLGFAVDGQISPLDALPNPGLYEERAYRIIFAQLGPLPLAKRIGTRAEIVERSAYTWINRLLALRAMEARGLIDKTLSASEEYGGISEKLYLLRLQQPERASGSDGGWWAVIEDACNELSVALRGLFALDDPSVPLRPSTPTLLQCIALLGGTQPLAIEATQEELDEAFADPDAISWAYQFYQEEAKARIYSKLGSGGKAESRAEIAAATELFTEPYMVQWLLQNSLGRSYHEAYPDSRLPATWAYYIQPEQRNGADGQATHIRSLTRLTIIDPCMGSGHFLRAAFDMLVDMYREQYPRLTAAEIAHTILGKHLHGIDLDPRAAQLAALTLYLRAWELVREEQRQQRRYDSAPFVPPEMHLATTPSIPNGGALQRHMERHPEEKRFQPLLHNIFASLEQAGILGSLLRPGEYLDAAIKDLQRPQTLELAFDPRAAEWHQSVLELAGKDPGELKQRLLRQVAESFQEEADGSDNVSAALFGRAAIEGVRLLQLLDRRYAVVVTNPPYMGSKNMDAPLKKYVEKHYAPGKRDLYAAFIMRCLELCEHGGRVAMVTQQSWMFLRSFAELRAVPAEKLEEVKKKGRFTGLLRKTSIEALTHLGRYAFSEIGNAVVAPVLVTLKYIAPLSKHKLWACRLTAPRPSEEQAELLLKAIQHNKAEGSISAPQQSSFLSLLESPLSYYLSNELIEQLRHNDRLQCAAHVKLGLTTSDDSRFLRYTWEIDTKSDRWATITKGGGYSKWFGQNWYHVDWAYGGARTKAFGKSFHRNTSFYFRPGWSYSRISRGSLSLRHTDIPGCIGDKGPGIYTDNNSLATVLQSHVLSFLLRAISPQLAFEANTIMQAPLPKNEYDVLSTLTMLAESLKRYLVSSSPTERTFTGNSNEKQENSLASLLHTIEGFAEYEVCKAYNLSYQAIQTVMADTGTPAGWYPLIANYDTLPNLPPDLHLPPLPQELYDYLAKHSRINPDTKELVRIKDRLRALYEAAPGAKEVEAEEGEAEAEGDDGEGEEMTLGAHIPIPTETFLEELSVKMQLHPISVYHLLEELRAGGVRCKPEEQRVLEDRLSVIVLRLLGHRWPKQIEAGERVPAWAATDGIIPLVSGTGKAMLAERVRQRMRAEDGEMATQQTEALLQELTGYSLEEWLRRRFFPRHVSQFKSRPIAWQLTSRPPQGTGTSKKRRSSGVQRRPAFECLLYYHACAGDALARIRTQYVEPLLRLEQSKATGGTLFDEEGSSLETAPAIALERVRELEAFIETLRQVEEQGFACPELGEALPTEPLDRWSGDGYIPPTTRSDLLRQEQAWRVDINDGVRVNIAPLQLGGVLATEVLAKKGDAAKALADRARWRADERRWVREGKLPRCGWMAEEVPASENWVAGESRPHKKSGQRQEEMV